LLIVKLTSSIRNCCATSQLFVSLVCEDEGVQFAFSQACSLRFLRRDDARGGGSPPGRLSISRDGADDVLNRRRRRRRRVLPPGGASMVINPAHITCRRRSVALRRAQFKVHARVMTQNDADGRKKKGARRTGTCLVVLPYIVRVGRRLLARVDHRLLSCTVGSSVGCTHAGSSRSIIVPRENSTPTTDHASVFSVFSVLCCLVCLVLCCFCPLLSCRRDKGTRANIKCAAQ
jgi:hypothetical protein